MPTVFAFYAIAANDLHYPMSLATAERVGKRTGDVECKVGGFIEAIALRAHQLRNQV